MKKNIVCILLSIIIVMVAIPTCASAAVKDGSCNGNSVQYCTTVSTSVSDAVKTLKLRAMVLSANLQIKALVKVAQATPYDDVDWLLARIENIVAPVFAYAESIGATVVCEYEQVVIDGRTVLIDPLKVINV